MGFLDRIKNAFAFTFTAKGNTNQVTNKRDNPTRKRAHVFIKQQYKSYQSAEIDNWIAAIISAQNVDNPRRYMVQDIYDNIAKNPHLQSEVQARKLRAIGKNFILKWQKDGAPNADIKKLFTKTWFSDFLGTCLDSLFYGTTLVEFNGDYLENGEFTRFYTVPRTHVSPTEKLILSQPFDIIGYRYDIEFSDTVIQIGKDEDLGLFQYLVPDVVNMKYALERWTDYIEKYGEPLRIIETSSKDETELSEIDSVLDNMGKVNHARFPEGTKIQLIEPRNGDSYQVYLQNIKTYKETISKMILGQSMATNDNGTTGSFAKAKIHKDIADDILEADLRFLENVVNQTLFPLLLRWGYPLEGLAFEFERPKEINHEKLQMVMSFIDKGYKVDTAWLANEFNIPLEETKDTNANFQPLPIKGTSLVANRFKAITNVPTVATINANAVTEIEKIFTSLAEKLYQNKITENDFRKQLTSAIYNEYEKAIKDGYVNIDYTYKDKHKAAFMRKNTFVFSGAKSYSELEELKQALTDDKGEIVPFHTFKEKAAKLNQTHNLTYLETEYNFAVASGQMASKWLQMQREKNLFPYWQYDAVLDQRTRPEHAALDGHIFAIDDEKAALYFPPNGWNCRCTVRQLTSDAKPTENPNYFDLKPPFDNNVGVSGIVFQDTHPYFSDIPKNEWAKYKDTLLEAWENTRFEQIHKAPNGKTVQKHEFCDLERFNQNKTLAILLANAGYNVLIREKKEDNGAKNAALLIEINENWYESNAKIKDNKDTNTVAYIQRSIYTANQQNAKVATIQLKKGFTKAQIIEALFSAIQKGRNKSVENIILIYDKKVVSLERKEILDKSFISKL